MQQYKSIAAAASLLMLGATQVHSSESRDVNNHSARHHVNNKIKHVIVGTDLNSADNPFVQPQDPALSGGGRDQSLQFGDVLVGGWRADLINGRLGTDIMVGNRSDDVFIGGLEHFNPFNRDRAFGDQGEDVFIWKPGDGSDLFRGGHGQDAVVFGVTGELVNGHPVFEVVNDQQAGELFIDPRTGLPKVDVTNSPGFCEVIDRNTSVDAAEQLEALELDHLVRFSIRAARDAFESGVQSDDNGLRVTLHLHDVEVLVCTNRAGGEIEIVDLTTSPAQLIDLHRLKPALRKRLEAILI